MRRFWIILAACMTAVLVSGISASAEAVRVPSKAEMLIEQLTDLPDMEEETISRGGYIQLLADIFRLGAPGTPEYVFSDVPPGSELGNAVYAALQSGWIAPADAFEPDRPVTGGEAVKMAVCAAGCRAPAEDPESRSAGYPMGYFVTAKRYGMLDGIQLDTAEPVSPGLAAELCYNLLRTQAAVSGAEQSFYTPGETWMEQLYGLFETEGIVSLAGYQSLQGGETDYGTDRLEISGTRYCYSGQITGLIGRRCTVFYRQEHGGIRQAVAVFPEPGQEQTFPAEDFQSFAGQTLSYTRPESGRTVAWRLDPGCQLLLNGRPAAWDAAYFADASEDVIGLDNDLDGRMEVVLVSRCQYVEVESADPLNQRIGGWENGAAAALDFGAWETWVDIFAADGAAGTLYDLAKGDLAAVFMTEDRQYAALRICTGIVSGRIETVRAQEREITVEGQVYKGSRRLFDQSGQLLAPGTVAVFRLGVDGELVTVETGQGNYTYGYLLASAQADGVFSNLSLRLVTQGGSTEVYPTADRVRTDGEMLDQKELAARLSQDVNGRLIRYRLSGDGAVSGLDFPCENQGLMMFEEQPEDNSLVRYTFPGTTVIYRSAAKACTPYFNLENTLIFKVPEDPNESEYAVVGGTELLVDNTGYAFEVYDLDSAGTAGAVVWRFDPKREKLTAADTSYLAGAVYRGLSPDGEEMRIIECWSGGSFQVLYMPFDVTVEKDNCADLESGDIFRVKLDSKGYVRAICVDMIREGAQAVPNSLSNAEFQGGNVNITYQYGKVCRIAGNFAYLADTRDIFGEYDYSFTGLKNYQINTQNLVRYQTKTGEIRPVTREEIKTYAGFGTACDFAVLRQSRFTTSLLVVYE